MVDSTGKARYYPPIHAEPVAISPRYLSEEERILIGDARCHRAAIEGRWATTMRFYAGPACLVIDELGYLPLPGEAASALFQVVNQRYLKSSIIMTTNRPAR
jgi:hypothetical protein